MSSYVHCTSYSYNMRRVRVPVLCNGRVTVWTSPAYTEGAPTPFLTVFYGNMRYNNMGKLTYMY